MLGLCRIPALLLALCLLISAEPSLAQEKSKQIPEPQISLEPWLTGPDHSDFRAEFKVLIPRLTYQQRYLVECRTAISGEIARGRELHSWVKVADNSGTWLPGSAHTGNDASPSLTKKNEVQVVSGFYANPGQYTVAFILYDARSKQYDVRHMPLTVKPIDGDPLSSHIERAPSSIEFLTDAPPGNSAFQNISDQNHGESDPLWPFARINDTYPLNSDRPLQIDVVLNLSDIGEATEIPQFRFPRYRPGSAPQILLPQQPRNAQQRQKEYIGALLSVAQVLAAVHPANGCVRINAVDVIDMNAPLHRVAPSKVDWEKIRDYRTTEKLAEVSVAALQNRKEQPNFIRKFLTSLEAPIENCGTGSASPIHAVIFVSHSFVFPSGAHKESFHFPDSSSFRAYHFLVNAGVRGVYDDLGAYLKSAGARSHDLEQPKDLRPALARTLDDLSRSAK